MNRILEKYRGGQPSAGTFTHMRSPVAVEALGTAGLDYVILDTEHCVQNPETLADCITAADAAGLDALVRINAIRREAVLRPLDLGAKGLIVPAVETVEEVERLVRFAKFPPLGNRGFCPTRDGLWGYDDASRAGSGAYMDRCNHETLLIPQCETAGCLAHIEKIAATEGVDGIFVGPLDLSIALGCPMELDAPPMREALKRVVDACKAAGKLTMIFCGDTAAAKARLAAGFDSVTLGLDVLTLIQSYRTMAEEIRG